MITYKISNYDKIFEETDLLHERFGQKEAFEYLEKNIDLKQLPSKYLKEYYYYAGSSQLIGYKNTSKALYFFNIGLGVEVDDDEFYHILITNMMGVVYYIEGKNNKAKKSFDESIEKLLNFEDMSIKKYDKTLLLLYNAAKFYSSIDNYEEAVSLCNQGIKIAFSENMMNHLELIYYEKGFNLCMLSKREGGRKNYIHSLLIAEEKENDVIVSTIYKDAKEFNLKL